MYISKKVRRNRKDFFGFVRFSVEEEAVRACRKLHGFKVGGSRIKVFFAKYGKGGQSMQPKHPYKGELQQVNRTIRFPAYRDTRKYSEVVVGRSRHKQLEKKDENVIPVLFSLHLSENEEVARSLPNTIIVENVEVMNTKHYASLVAASNVPVKSMFYLSPTKLILMLNSDSEVKNVVKEDSVLWNIFDDLRIWTEGESFSDRIVWIDCFGLHPKCSSLDNIKKIGERWGPILCVEKDVNGVESLTSARLLVRTNAQNKIDARVRITFDSGLCEV